MGFFHFQDELAEAKHSSDDVQEMMKQHKQDLQKLKSEKQSLEADEKVRRFMSCPLVLCIVLSQ